MPDLKDLLAFAARKANEPLLQREQLRRAFSAPPDALQALPGHYLRHLREVFSDPRKLRLALTDVTPLSLLTNALTIPATIKMLKMYPERRTETVMGAIGNILGGQLMQRTGIAGGILGGLGGEVLGRLLAQPLTHTRRRRAGAVAERIQGLRDAGQKIDAVLEAAQNKIGSDKNAGLARGVLAPMVLGLSSTWAVPPDLPTSALDLVHSVAEAGVSRRRREDMLKRLRDSSPVATVTGPANPVTTSSITPARIMASLPASSQPKAEPGARPSVRPNISLQPRPVRRPITDGPSALDSIGSSLSELVSRIIGAARSGGRAMRNAWTKTTTPTHNTSAYTTGPRFVDAPSLRERMIGRFVAHIGGQPTHHADPNMRKELESRRQLSRAQYPVKRGSDVLHGVGGAEGMSQPVVNTTEPSIGGTLPEFQDRPAQYGNRKLISGYGNTIETGDTLVGNLIRLLGLGDIHTTRPGDPFGQRVDLEPVMGGHTRDMVPGHNHEPVTRS